MKKDNIIKYLITIAIMILVFIITLYAYAESTEDNYIGLLRGLNVDVDETKLSDEISKTDFFRCILKIKGIETEVDPIQTAQDYGLAEYIRTGDAEEGVTYEEAVTVFIKLLGYKNTATLSGGYPNGYIKTANNLKLNKDVKNIKGKITYEDAYVMCCNALETNIMKQDSQGIWDKTDEILLNEIDIYKSSGMVTGIKGVSLGGEIVNPDGYVAINSELYCAGNLYDESLIGEIVVYYYKDDGDDKSIIYMYYKNDTNHSFGIEMFEKVEKIGKNKFRVEYETYKGANKRVSVEPKYVLLNNELIEFSESDIETLFEFTLGNVSLISTDGGRIYDIIKINKYENYIVNSIGNRYIYDKNSKAPLSTEADNVIVKKNGERITLDEIKSGDVLSVYKNSKDELIITVSSDRLTGTVQRAEKDSTGYDRLIINDYPYTVSADAKKASPGGTYEFYIDAFGVIADFDEKESNEWYGYLINLYIDNDELGRVIILDENNKVKEYAFDELRVTTGSTSTKYSAEELAASFKNGDVFKHKLIRFTENNGIIKNINEASQNTDDSFHFNEEVKEATYKYGKLGRYFIDKDTKIFTASSTGDKNVRYYKTSYSISEWGTYNVQIYDVDNWNRAGAVIFMIDDYNIPSLNNLDIDGVYIPPAIVVSTGEYYDNEEEEVGIKLTVYWKGGLVDIPLYYSEKGLYQTTDGKIDTTKTLLDTTKISEYLKKGDVIQPMRDKSTGKLACIRKIFSAKERSMPLANASGYYSHVVSGWPMFVYGEVVDLSDEYIKVDTSNPNLPDKDLGIDVYTNKFHKIESVGWGYGYIKDEKGKVMPATNEDIEIGDDIMMMLSKDGIIAFEIIRN